MKVTMQQVSDGVARYIDRDLVPKAQGFGKWVIGLSGAYSTAIVQTMMSEHKGLLSSLGIMSEDGMIEIDDLASNLKSVASSVGPVTHHIPIVGDVTFDVSDIERLHSYIVG